MSQDWIEFFAWDDIFFTSLFLLLVGVVVTGWTECHRYGLVALDDLVAPLTIVIDTAV